MSVELVMWSILGLICLVGGALGLAALWSLIKAPKN